ncbi:MAG: ABC transporter ATP-binding protein [Syntrophobacterales bacterium]|nr:MAG: ABC transporter ATP-binding protein [Syntrophobacterales bacterium]
MGNFRTLREYFVQNRWRLLAGLATLLVVDGLQLIIPQIIRWAIDDLTIGGIVQAALIKYGIYIAVIALLIGFFRYFWRLMILGTARRIEEALRNRLFSHLQILSLSFFQETKTGDLMAHATNDIDAVRMAVGMGLVAITDTLVLGVSSIVFMILIDPRLTLFAIIPMPFIALVTTRFSRLVHHRFEGVQASFSRLTEGVRESLAGIRVIKAFVQEEHEKGKLGHIGQEYVGKNLRLIKVWGMFFPLIILLANLGTVIVLWRGGIETIVGIITAGDFVAFMTYLGILTWPMMALGWVINLIQRGSASMGRINKILNTQPEIVGLPSIRPISKLEGKIEFRDLTFSYKTGLPPALKGITFDVNPGEFVAIVGRTGTGKTTLCNLIPRLFGPPSGHLFLDGREIHAIPVEVVRGSVGYVPQDTFLFSNTIRENIVFGNPQASEEEIAKAARIAQIDEDIRSFPMGIETVIGEKGVTLSGGQKQRIAIARAILLNPQIMILDDALSSVDTQTEERIWNGLSEILVGKTRIVVSHRLSSIKEADKTIVLDDGEIKEMGNHASLLSMGGIYAEIYRRQQIEEELDGENRRVSIHAR